MKTTCKKIVLSLFLLSLCIRLLFFFTVLKGGAGGWFVFDSAQYHELASSLVTGKGLVDKVGAINFYRLPGYPYFLALLYKITHNNVPWAQLIQVIITSISPLLVGALSLVLQPKKYLTAAALTLLSTVHVGFILYTGMIATEGIFLVLILLFYMLFFSFYKPGDKVIFNKKAMLYAAAAGVVLGLLSMVRPVGHYVLLASLLLMLIFTAYSWREKLALAGTLLLGWLTVVIWWLVRNWLLTGYFFFHTLPGLHFMQYSAANTYMATHNVRYLTARARLLDERDLAVAAAKNKLGKHFNAYHQCQIGEQIAAKHIQENIPAFLKYTTIQLVKTMTALHATHLLYIDQGWADFKASTTTWEKMRRYLMPQGVRWYTVPLIYLDIAVMLFMLVGLFLFLVRCLYLVRYRWFAVRVLPMAGLFVLLTAAYGCARLRMPAEPLFFMLATYVLVDIWGRGNGQKE